MEELTEETQTPCSHSVRGLRYPQSLPIKPIRVILLRYIRFSCSACLSRAPESEWARLPRQEAAFLGGPKRGSQNRRVREQSRSFADAGHPKSPEAVPRPTGRTGDSTERNIMLRVAAVVGTAQSKPSQLASTVLEVDAGGLAVVVTHAWLGNWHAPEYSAKTTRRRDASASETSAATSLGKQNHRRIYREVSAES